MNDITFVDGIGVAAVAMSIVFLILVVIMICLTFFKHLGKFETKQEVVKNVESSESRSTVSKLDVNNEDMVVASLIATIEASEEYGCELRVVNIREIGVG